MQADNTVVSPLKLIAVGITNGKLDAVSLVDGSGAEVPGTFDSQRAVWRNSAPLCSTPKIPAVAQARAASGS